MSGVHSLKAKKKKIFNDLTDVMEASSQSFPLEVKVKNHIEIEWGTINAEILLLQPVC